jgi:hypothetical protein
LAEPGYYIFALGSFDAGQQAEYQIKTEETAHMCFFRGRYNRTAGQALNKRDAIGVYDTDSFTIETSSDQQSIDHRSTDVISKPK